MPVIHKLVTPILDEIETLKDIEVLVDVACGLDPRCRNSASFLVLSQLVVELAKQNRELAKQNRELSDRLENLEKQVHKVGSKDHNYSDGTEALRERSGDRDAGR